MVIVPASNLPLTGKALKMAATTGHSNNKSMGADKAQMVPNHPLAHCLLSAHGALTKGVTLCTDFMAFRAPQQDTRLSINWPF